MGDIGPAHHAAEDRAQPRVVQHLLGEDNERAMHIVLGYGSGDAVQVSRSHAQRPLAAADSMLCVCVIGKLTHEDPTIRRRSYLGEQTPCSQYNS
jgi:hypothetical protein